MADLEVALYELVLNKGELLPLWMRLRSHIEVDAEAAHRARERYACFDHFGPDPQVYQVGFPRFLFDPRRVEGTLLEPRDRRH